MASKTDTEVIIGGKVFTLSGYEGEEYLQKVASYINNKISEYNKIDGFKRQPIDTQNVLLQLNIADDYFKLKKQIELMEEQLTEKDVVWYVYKLEDDGYHIDGYPAAKVTYNSNYPEDSKKENAAPVVHGQRVNNTSYTVKDVKFDAPEGYFFAGWFMTPDCSGEEVKVGDTFENISYNVNLYAKWTHFLTLYNKKLF